MSAAFGEVAPLALALAVSPFAVVTGVVLLLGERGEGKAAAFGLGWFAGILLIASVAFWVVDAAYDSGYDDTDAAVDLLQIGLGVVFLGLAAMSWRKRPAAGERPREAKLLDRLSEMTVAGALGLGAAQSVLVIKNVPLAVGAGVAIGEAGATASEAAASLVAFALVASAGIFGPVLAAVVGGEAASTRLARLRDWLEANLTTITVTILVLLGVVFLVSGAAALPLEVPGRTGGAAP